MEQGCQLKYLKRFCYPEAMNRPRGRYVWNLMNNTLFRTPRGPACVSLELKGKMYKNIHNGVEYALWTDMMMARWVSGWLGGCLVG